MIHVDDLLFSGSTDLWNNKFLKGMTQRFKVSHSELKEDGSSISFFKRCLVKLAYGLMIVPGTTVEKVVSCFACEWWQSLQECDCIAALCCAKTCGHHVYSEGTGSLYVSPYFVFPLAFEKVGWILEEQRWHVHQIEGATTWWREMEDRRRKILDVGIFRWRWLVCQQETP